MTEIASASESPAEESLVDLLEAQRIARQATVIGRLILVAGTASSCLIFWWLAKLFSIPNEPGFSISLLQQPHCLIALFVLLAGTIAALFVAGLITRWIRPEAALMCTALGLASISLRGGPLKETLFDAGGAGVFAALAMETALLFGFLFVAVSLVDRTSAALTDSQPEAAVDLDEQGLAIFAHAAAMSVVLLFLCRSDAKLQSMFSVALSAAVGAFVARQVVTMRALGWLWISPLIVAILGYMIAWFHPETMQIGELHGSLAPLARPLPLDYAGMGVAGTIVGYWMGGGEENEE